MPQIQQSLDAPTSERLARATDDEKTAIVDTVAGRNVLRMVHEIVTQSRTIGSLVQQGRIAVVGALYDVRSGTWIFSRTIRLQQNRWQDRHRDGLTGESNGRPYIIFI